MTTFLAPLRPVCPSSAYRTTSEPGVLCHRRDRARRGMCVASAKRFVATGPLLDVRPVLTSGIVRRARNRDCARDLIARCKVPRDKGRESVDDRLACRAVGFDCQGIDKRLGDPMRLWLRERVLTPIGHAVRRLVGGQGAHCGVRGTEPRGVCLNVTVVVHRATIDPEEMPTNSTSAHRQMSAQGLHQDPPWFRTNPLTWSSAGLWQFDLWVRESEATWVRGARELPPGSWDVARRRSLRSLPTAHVMSPPPYVEVTQGAPEGAYRDASSDSHTPFALA